MTFDPAQHLTPARKGGPADYLQVKWRIVWLRHEHPDAEISTEERHHEIGQSATFWARVTIPGKGSATGHGMEERKDFHDYYEKAEAKAIGRAIANLGYGTQFVGNELDEGERIVDSPTEPRLTAAQFETVIADAWIKANNGATYPELVSHMREYRARFTPDQYEDSVEEMRKLKRATAPQPPASIAG